MLRFISLASGSTGNATLVEARDGTTCTRVLIDCGMGQRRLHECLERAAVDPSRLDAIFVTHEHADHIGCALTLSRRHRIPLWMSAGTHEAVQDGRADPHLHLATDGQAIALGDLLIEPFTVPHDAREPLQLVCTNGDRRLAVLTDLGHCTPHVLERLGGCHALMLESNHDPDLLAASRYPSFLKRRIGGALGHLSNGQAAAVLGQLPHDGLRHVVAAHLSESNNNPDLVRRVLAQALGTGVDDILVATRNGLHWLDV